MHFCNPVEWHQCILCVRKHFHPLCMHNHCLVNIVHGQLFTLCMTWHALYCIHFMCDVYQLFTHPVHGAWCIRTVFSPDDGSFIPKAGGPYARTGDSRKYTTHTLTWQLLTYKKFLQSWWYFWLQVCVCCIQVQCRVEWCGAFWRDDSKPIVGQCWTTSPQHIIVIHKASQNVSYFSLPSLIEILLCEQVRHNEIISWHSSVPKIKIWLLPLLAYYGPLIL